MAAERLSEARRTTWIMDAQKGLFAHMETLKQLEGMKTNSRALITDNILLKSPLPTLLKNGQWSSAYRNTK